MWLHSSAIQRTPIPEVAGRSRLLWIAALAAIASCSSTPETVVPGTADTPGAALAVIAGAWQQGFLGEPLVDSVAVQIVDVGGRAVRERRPIRFTVSAGGGSVSDTVVLSAETGVASVAWRLGTSGGEQNLTAAIADLRSAPVTPIYASGVSPTAADLVVIRGLSQGDAHILIRQDNSTWTYSLAWPDTVLRLLPHGPRNDGPAGSRSWQEVTVFTLDHPPETVLQPWTDDVDTVRLALRPAIAVPFTVVVTHDFDTTAARARYDLTNLDGFWRSHMTGLRVGRIRIENAPQLNGPIVGCADVSTPYDPKAFNVYYLPAMIDGESGRTCGPNVVLVGMNTIWSYDPRYAYVFVHGVGHALSLDHIGDENNVMSGDGVIGSGLRIGQIYWMHFDSGGGLNATLGIHPVGERNCSLPLSSHCPAQTFTAW